MSKKHRQQQQQPAVINTDAPVQNPEVTDEIREQVENKLIDLITDAPHTVASTDAEQIDAGVDKIMAVIENATPVIEVTSQPVVQVASTGKIEVPVDYKGETYPQMLARLGTKSAVIRYLNQERWTNGQINRFMGIRYQHVFNVLKNPLKTPAAGQ